jgi:hypothetical protein
MTDDDIVDVDVADELEFEQKTASLADMLTATGQSASVNAALKSLNGTVFGGGFLWVPSDIIVHSHSILEAVRGLYDKYINCADLLQLNISGGAYIAVDHFILAHCQEVKRIFDHQSMMTHVSITDTETEQHSSDADVNDEISVHEATLVHEMAINDENYVKGTDLRVVGVSQKEKRKLLRNFVKQQTVKPHIAICFNLVSVSVFF